MNNITKIYVIVIVLLVIAILCILLFAEGNNKAFFLIPLVPLVWIGLGISNGDIYLGPSKKDLKQTEDRKYLDLFSRAMRDVGLGVNSTPKPLQTPPSQPN